MDLVEAILISKMGVLDELVKERQVEMKSMPNEPLNVQADFLCQLVSQAVNEVVRVEFERGSTRTALMFMQDGHRYPFALDWQLPPEAFVDRLMDQVIVTYAEDLYGVGGNDHDENL